MTAEQRRQLLDFFDGNLRYFGAVARRNEDRDVKLHFTSNMSPVDLMFMMSTMLADLADAIAESEQKLSQDSADTPQSPRDSPDGETPEKPTEH